MEIGISTASLYPLETENALEALVARGVRLVELFFNAPCETEPAFVRQMCQTARAAGTEVRAVHPYTSGFESFLFFSNYRRRFEDAVRWYEDFYTAANVLGARVMALHGDHPGGPLTSEEYYERFGELARHARTYGITLAQENISWCRSGSPDFIRGMREYLGEEAAFVLDLKQTIRAGIAPWDMLDAMGERVVHLHLSDNRGAREVCLPPGSGDFDFPAFFSRLRQQGYTGAGMVELYRNNYRDIEQLVESMHYLEKLV